MSDAVHEQERRPVKDLVEQPSNLEDPTDLRSAIASGLAWNTLLSIGIQASRLVSSLVLVHLLQPRDYGLAGMALVLGAFVANFQDLGFGDALIQRPSITEEDRSTAFWTTVAMGVVLNLAVIGLAGPIASYFREPRVKSLVIGLSFTLLLGSLGMTQGSLLHRAMRFRSITIRLMIATVGACATSIAVAAAGGGAWALIAYQLAITTLVTASLWQLCAWWPKLVFSRASFKKLAGFGANMVGTSFVDFFQTNADNILIGRYLGSLPLGLYTVSYNVILIPAGRLFIPLGGTLFAAVSRIQAERDRVGRLWLRATRGVLTVIMPVIFGLFVVAPDFVEVILGKRWHAATPVIRILGFITITAGLTSIANSILNALGRPHIVFRLTLFNTLLAVGAFIVGLRWGIVGVAASYAAVTIPINLTRVLLVNRMVGVSLGDFLRAVSGVAQAVLVLLVVCWLSREGMLSVGTSASLRLATVILIGLVTYVLATLWRNRAVIAEIKSVVPRRRPIDPGNTSAT